MNTDSDKDLKKVCERIVANFDNICLEPDRQLKQKIMQWLKKPQTEYQCISQALMVFGGAFHAGPGGTLSLFVKRKAWMPKRPQTKIPAIADNRLIKKPRHLQKVTRLFV